MLCSNKVNVIFTCDVIERSFTKCIDKCYPYVYLTMSFYILNFFILTFHIVPSFGF